MKGTNIINQQSEKLMNLSDFNILLTYQKGVILQIIFKSVTGIYNVESIIN